MGLRGRGSCSNVMIEATRDLCGIDWRDDRSRLLIYERDTGMKSYSGDGETVCCTHRKRGTRRVVGFKGRHGGVVGVNFFMSKPTSWPAAPN